MLSKKERKKLTGKMRSMRLLSVFLIPAAALILGSVISDGWAQDCWFNIELNATDLDVGVRGFFDDDPWNELEIENPRGRTISEDESKRGLKRQGKAEWFFESGEPPLTEVSFRKFFRRFPEGDYIFEAELIDGGEVECIAEFTHDIPCPPETELEDNVISWDQATTSVDTDQTDKNVADGIEGIVAVVCVDDDLVIDGYEVIVEGLTSTPGDPEAEEVEFSIKLPGDATEVMVPPQVVTITKFEVLRIEESGNQTITEEEVD